VPGVSDTASKPLALSFRPLTSELWPDLEALFGARGACGGCWCMTWRLTRAEYERNRGEPNRRAFQQIVASGTPVGLLAYVESEPVGWCAIAPRDEFPTLDRSRILKRIDELPVWSVVCFFVRRAYRHKGISTRLLSAAVDFAAEQGARIVEGYPVEPRKAEMPSIFAWTGLAASFRQAGFVEVARRSETRPIMRIEPSECA
jgi:GNAT superfamily N-acetyltransferase